MGHCISVYLIDKSEIRSEKIDIIIGSKTSDDIKWVEMGSNILATTYIPNIKKFGEGKTIASIATDYFGGNGHQSAKLFINNKKVYDESDENDYKLRPINSVLKMMGVVRKSHMDEFDTIGLSDYRHNGDFNPKK